MINNPNRIIRPFERPFYGQFDTDIYQFLRIGRIDKIDNETNSATIVWMDHVGGNFETPISAAISGPRSFLGGMPEEGSLVLCGFTKQNQTSGKAQILAYLTEGYKDCLRYFLDHGNLDIDQESIINAEFLNNTNIDQFIENKINHVVKRHKRRKLYPGDIIAESAPGAEAYLDENIFISDSALDQIELRAADHHIISNSVNNTTITGAAKIKNGIITRNLTSDNIAIQQDDDITDTTIAPFQQFIVLPNGKRLFVATTDNKSLDNTDIESTNQAGGGALTEFRTEIREVCNGELNVTEEIGESEIDSFTSQPFITQIMGTNVGNDPQNRNTYGRVLRPKIFVTSEDDKAQVGDDVVTDPFKYRSLATAYELKFSNFGQYGKEVSEKKFKNTTKISIDKEGHVFINLSASNSDHHLGAGRSLEFNSDGGLKLVVGANTAKTESILLHTTGGVRAILGTNNDKNSLDLNLKSALKLTINSGDNNGAGFISNITGNVEENIKGNKTVNISGTLTTIVNGVIDERIRGTKLETFVNDKQTNYGGDYISNVLNKQRVNVGLSNTLNICGDPKNQEQSVNKTTIVGGTDELTIQFGHKKTNITKSGNIVESIKLGNRTLTIDLGNCEETLKSGNKTITLTSGTYKVQVGTGSIVFDSSTIKLGGDTAVQPIILGWKLLSYIMTHKHMAPMGPTTPPIDIPSADMLSNISFVK